MAVAWIGLGGAIAAALVSGFVALRQSQMAERLARVQSDLATEQHKREAMIDRSLVAEDVLKRYREPLAAAAFDLQSRIYNILRLDFFARFPNGSARADDAVRTTSFRLAQYFGWTEILRREIQFLSFPQDDDTRCVARLQSDIAKSFLAYDYGPELMIWSDEQRAIGEQMIVKEHGHVLCMGYARFRDHCDDTFAGLCGRVGSEIEAPNAESRLCNAQHLLCELVEKLDRERVRYTDDLERA
jgi:hypothetical protein